MGPYREDDECMRAEIDRLSNEISGLVQENERLRKKLAGPPRGPIVTARRIGIFLVWLCLNGLVQAIWGLFCVDQRLADSSWDWSTAYDVTVGRVIFAAILNGLACGIALIFKGDK